MSSQTLVFNLISKIPKGRVATYKQIAALSGLKSPRTVGHMLHGNIDPVKYPCHKVVRSDGTIAQGYAFGGKKEQIKLLKKEGIEIKKQKINLKKYLFIPH